MGAAGSPEKTVNIWQAKWHRIQDFSIFAVNTAVTSDGIQFYCACEGTGSEEVAPRLQCTITSSYSGNRSLHIFGFIRDFS